MKKTGKTSYPDLEHFPSCPYCGETCPEFDLSTMVLNGDCTKCQHYDNKAHVHDHKPATFNHVNPMLTR